MLTSTIIHKRMRNGSKTLPIKHIYVLSQSIPFTLEMTARWMMSIGYNYFHVIVFFFIIIIILLIFTITFRLPFI